MARFVTTFQVPGPLSGTSATRNSLVNVPDTALATALTLTKGSGSLTVEGVEGENVLLDALVVTGASDGRGSVGVLTAA